MKQVEEEYYKAEEKVAQAPNGNQNNSAQNSGAQELYPPSPDQPLNTMTTNMPEPVKDAVNSLIKSHTTIETNNNNENVIVIPETQPVNEDERPYDPKEIVIKI
jgi:hypothetical protein